MRLYTPTLQLQRSHASTTGANRNEIRRVPMCWSAKRSTKMQHDTITTMFWCKCGAATEIPEIADITEMDGVRMPSPITMEVPSSTMMRSPVLRHRCFSRSLRTFSPRIVSGSSTNL
ncbi:hypothetical protein M758_2G049200 [Ceratodon purpureus]|nr:hypothetical protein M758_2G049200 [Ceratodon purpureus]